MERHAKLIRDFYIYSLKEFDELEGKIVQLCDENNARAYFRLNVRDAKKIAFQYNKRLAELLITEDYKAIPKSYASVTGEYHSDPDKKWLIDYDYTDDDENNSNLYLMELKVRNVFFNGNKENAIVAKIPTMNGIHLITRPFRLDVFKQEFPNVDVHKDNPTILYMP
jgi:hypothetical protein